MFTSLDLFYKSPIKFNDSTSNALKEFIETGKLIRKYSPSGFERLENLIERLEDSDIVLNGTDMYKENGGTSNIFIALIAPSMTGKTQLAFTIQKKTPLYFPFARNRIIYSNFYALSLEMKKFATIDCSNVLASPFVREIDNSDIITLTKLAEDPHVKLYTLGFLHSLMSEGLKKYSGSHDIPISDWMHHFSNLQLKPGATIVPLSTNDFLGNPRFHRFVVKFYVFLDEFVGTPELIYIRNLCRAIGLTCVVASTNSKSANLIGLSSESGSRSEDPSVWSVVVPSLPLVPKEAISQTFELKNSLKKISEYVNVNDRARMDIFFDYLTVQCQNSRPGVSKMIDSFLSTYSSPSNIDKACIDDIFSDLIHNIAKRIALKKKFFTDPRGIDSNIKLMIGKHFDPLFDPKGEEDESSQTIDNHFFYLKNPYAPGKEAFLLYRSLYENLPIPPLYVCRDFDYPIRYNSQCYFNIDEEILMLACLSGELATTTSKMFSNPYSKAKKQSGAALENKTCAAIIDSSHFTSDRLDGCLEGVPLDNFISNFVGNLDSFLGLSRDKRSRIHFSKVPELEKFCSSLKVPFLFPTNIKVPKGLQALFPVNESKLKFGEYTRTKSNAVVDAIFDLFDQKNEKNIAIVECKNRKENFSADDLLLNLKKGFQFCEEETLPKCLVHLTVCQKMAKFESPRTNWTALSSFTESKRINVYCLTPSLEEGFELIPVTMKHDLLSLFENPDMISIIIDMSLIKNHYAKLGETSLSKKVKKIEFDSK